MKKSLSILAVVLLSCSSSGEEVDIALEQNIETESSSGSLTISYLDKEGSIQIEDLSDRPTLIIFWADLFLHKCTAQNRKHPKL